MANRRLISLRIDGPVSAPETQMNKTDSWVMQPLFDSTALEDSGSVSTKTTIPRRVKPGISAKERGKRIAAARIVREKYGDSYIPLACEHYTTYQDQQQYRQHARRGKYFCETCGAWRKARPKPSRDPLPDVPPFLADG